MTDLTRRLRLTIALCATAGVLAACGGGSGVGSGLNPFKWFRKDREVTAEAVEVADPRALVASVKSLKVDRMPGGAIIRAVGLAAVQGVYDAELVPLGGSETPDGGVLTYEFRVMPPRTVTSVGAERSREVLVGHFVSDQTLTGVRRITVIGQSNRRTTRR